MTSGDNGTRSIEVATGSIELAAAEGLIRELLRAVKDHGVTVTISLYPFGEIDVETTETPSA